MQYRKKRYIIIDDDAVFLKIIKAKAAARSIDVETCESLAHLGTIGRLSEFDAALVDFHLGCLTGLDIGKYLSALFAGKPMLLCSASEQQKPEDGWPEAVKRFIPKSAGFDRLLDALEEL